jgi:hypothetical protein
MEDIRVEKMCDFVDSAGVWMSSKFDSSFLESEMACSSMLDMKLKAKS